MSRRVHDAVARGYNSAGGIIGEKNRIVLDALRTRWPDNAAPLRVADLGVGDGAFLAALASLGMPLAMSGLDISPAMLRLAAARVPLATVQASAEQALIHLPAGAFDLVVAHFVFAYVARGALLSQARGLLAPGGIVSIVTTTHEGGAPFLEGLEAHFRHGMHPVRRAVGWAADRALEKSQVPRTYEALAADIEAAGLEVLSRRTLRVPVSFAGPADAYRFGIEEGWAANLLTVPLVPVKLAQALVRWGTRQGRYPFNFTHVIEIVEAGHGGNPGRAP